ncbi:MAG: ABC transporter permease [Pseudomonadota bacterium]
MNAFTQSQFLEISEQADQQVISLRDDWTFDHVSDLEDALHGFGPAGASSVQFRCGGLQNIDIAGAWVLHKRALELRAEGIPTDFAGFKAAHFKFLDHIAETGFKPDDTESGNGRREAVADRIRRLGRATTHWVSDLGAIGQAILDGVRSPGVLGVKETVRQLQLVGLNAVPIVALICFLIGLVTAYQGALQLTQFGATTFVVDLVAISVLREMGVIMEAIMVAGRSGSAFAASLGSMNLNQETDALRVMGLNPNRILIAPRVVALVIALPLLTIVADIAGLAGGWVLCVTTLDMSTPLFLSRLQGAADLSTFFVGLVKAPVFALLIGAVGTLRGMQVQSSSEELGRMTTVAVVQSIFLVVLADGVFTIIFARLGL